MAKERKYPQYSFDLILKQKISISATDEERKIIEKLKKIRRVTPQAEFFRKVLIRKLKRDGIESLNDFIKVADLDREKKNFIKAVQDALVDWFKGKNFSELIVSEIKREVEVYERRHKK